MDAGRILRPVSEIRGGTPPRKLYAAEDLYREDTLVGVVPSSWWEGRGRGATYQRPLSTPLDEATHLRENNRNGMVGGETTATSATSRYSSPVLCSCFFLADARSSDDVIPFQGISNMWQVANATHRKDFAASAEWMFSHARAGDGVMPQACTVRRSKIPLSNRESARGH